jgi:hypothetical protein
VTDGRVLVRLISLENCPPGFGELVTKTINIQNTIEERDFKSLDGVQAALREDFALDLSLCYVIRRGEPEPDPNKGCTITEAAEALAPIHSNAQFAAYAKRDLAELWKDDAYREQFGSKPKLGIDVDDLVIANHHSPPSCRTPRRTGASSGSYTQYVPTLGSAFEAERPRAIARVGSAHSARSWRTASRTVN